MSRAFGTDARNAAPSSESSSSAMKVAPAPRQSSMNLLLSLNKQKRQQGSSGLMDRALGIDRSKVSKDRSWLRDMEREQREAAAPAPKSAAPVCRNFVEEGYCVYGDQCGFDHPPSAAKPIPVEDKMDTDAPAAASLPTPTSPTFSSLATLPPLAPPPSVSRATAQRISVPVLPQTPTRRSSEPFVAASPLRPRNGSRVRDASPLKTSVPAAPMLTDRLLPVKERRRPSLAPTLSAPSTVFDSRGLPGQPAFLVPEKERRDSAAVAHPDAPPAVPILPPMFYATYRRGSNGEVLDPALIPHAVQAQKSLYYRTKPCRYWSNGQECPKADKCTFIHDPALGPGAEKHNEVAQPEEFQQQQDDEEREVVEAVLVKKPSTPAPRLPPPTPSSSKVREPHPAWRVVGGGVTLANFVSSTEDQMDEDAVEAALPVSSPIPVPIPQVQVQPQVQVHNGFPAYAMPQHAVYAAYAQPSPVAYQQPQPVQYQQQPAQPQYVAAPQAQYATPPPPPPSQQQQQGPVSAYGIPLALHGTPVPDPQWPGWTVHVVRVPGEPVPVYSTIPMYGPPGVVWIPPTPSASAPQPVAAPQPQYPQQVQFQQPQVQYQQPQQPQYSTTPVPVLYGTTSSAYVYGFPADVRSVELLADAGVDVSRLDGRAPVFSDPFQSSRAGSVPEDGAAMVDGEDELAELEGYGVTSFDEAFGGQEVDVRGGVIGQGMVSSVAAPAPAPAPVVVALAPSKAKYSVPAKRPAPQPLPQQRTWSWADEVEEMDPQYVSSSGKVTTADVEMVDAPAAPVQQHISASWPGSTTAPNSPRMRARRSVPVFATAKPVVEAAW